MYLNGIKLEAGTRVKCIALKDPEYWMYYDIGDICTVGKDGRLINPRTEHTDLGGIGAFWEFHQINTVPYEDMM